MSPGVAATKGAPDDQAQLVQAARPRADGEDGRELHRGARVAAGRGGPEGDRGPALTVSDVAIRERTGRGWEEWFDLLDESGAVERSHAEIARWLAEEHGLTGWDAQAVRLTYERARNLRAVGEGPNGFTVTASKTVAVPVERLFDAFVDESVRGRWLPDGELRERTATKPRSARFDWGEGDTRVVVAFEAKGDGKSSTSLLHERLPDAAEAERMKTFWRDRVATLKEVLEA